MNQGIYVLQSPLDTGDNTLPTLVRDPLLNGANGGVKFLFDLAFPWCYPGGPLSGRPAAGTPASGATVYDMTENGNASLLAQSGDVTSYAGGGFDFSSVTKFGNMIQGSSGAFATSVYGSAQQYFLICAYVKLPTLANWFSNAGIMEIMKFAANGQTYQSGPELAIMAFAPSGALSFRRQNGSGTADYPTNLTPASADYGGFAQLALWRDASGLTARLKTTNGVVQSTGLVGTPNNQNFSGLTVKIGVPPGFAGGALGGTLGSGATNAVKFRLYRAFGENLYLSGRSAATVLDADYTRTVNRGVFS